jgi:cysteine desulfurase
MGATRAYLDHNASVPLRKRAQAAMIDALGAANPSSIHGEGRAARKLVEDARRSVARLVDGKPEHVVFTSGATEAAATLLTPHWHMGRAELRMSHVYVCETDHPCLLGGGRFGPDRVTRVKVDRDGVTDLRALEAALSVHDRADGLALVAMHWANNETGVVQPVADVATIVKAAGAVLVLDAVQAAGRLPVDLANGCADYLILSSHKIGGPKGVGAIVAASDLMMPQHLIGGGGQERGHRAGTENLPGIVGFGAAAEEALDQLPMMDGVRARRDELEAFLAGFGVEIFGSGAERLPNTIFFGMPGMKAETAQIAFDLEGIALSAGSACSSGKVGPSHVLTAMGFGDRHGALRVSIGTATSEADLDLFRSAFARLMERQAGRNAA